ncbi:MAG: pentapeptide repeat-containing protein [Alphaproteobacteria bacterium]
MNDNHYLGDCMGYLCKKFSQAVGNLWNNLWFHETTATDVTRETQRAAKQQKSLDGSDLKNLNLSGALIDGLAHDHLLSMKKSDFSGSNLSGARFSFVDLSEADFTGADLSKTTFVGCNLSKANMEQAMLAGARFSDCDISEATMKGANLSGARLFGCALSNSNMSETIQENLEVSSCWGNKNTQIKPSQKIKSLCV